MKEEGVEVKVDGDGVVRRARTRALIASPLAPMISYKGRHI
jgi:hypothetical protein